MPSPSDDAEQHRRLLAEYQARQYVAQQKSRQARTIVPVALLFGVLAMFFGYAMDTGALLVVGILLVLAGVALFLWNVIRARR